MGGFMVKLFKDRFTEEQLQKLGLNERQVKAVLYVKENGKITNSESLELNNTTAKTAFRDFEELLAQNILKRVGNNKNAYYEIQNV
jgi:ATP-dependent DNA helicase RecG